MLKDQVAQEYGPARLKGTSLQEFLRQNGQQLFDMTARGHGESKDTSLEGGKNRKARPSLRKRPRDDAGQGLGDDDGANANKKMKAQPKGGGDEKQENPTNERSNFITMKWDPQQFYDFLASADADMDGLEIPIESEDVNDFEDIMSDSMRLHTFPSEPAMEGHLCDRFHCLSPVLSSALGENDTAFLGLKSTKQAKEYLPSGLGPDNQVDMILSRKRQNTNVPIGIIPWENKVPWNYPGGSLTSQLQDYARLGRDVKLYELIPETPCSSLADRNKTQESEIANPAEGEDSNIVDAARAQQAGTDETGLKDGQYVMKHNVFPVRQIVSYMLSLKTRYGILFTGYRIDFLMLKVVNKDSPEEQLQVHIAGPLWCVGSLNTRVVDRKRIVGDVETEYYKNIHRYGKNDEAETVSIFDMDQWSTKIGQYPFLEGLVRFLFAATKLETVEEQGDQRGDDEGQTSTSSTAKQPPRTQYTRPHSHMPNTEMPSWVSDYVRRRQQRQSRKKRNESYEKLCEGSEPFYFENEQVKEAYLSMMKTEYGCNWSPSVTLPIDDDDVESWKGGLTKFGPLTLAELEGGEREAIGFGRIGEAFKTKLQDLHVAYKLLRRSEWEDEDFDQRVEELKHEMKIYEFLQQHQGTIIPRFLYAGSIVDALCWVIPECGEMIAFTTTYEGESLSSYIESGHVGTLRLKGTVRDQAIGDLKKLHSLGVAHRDLVLRNLVYDQKKNRIMFVDFGNAWCKNDYNSYQSFMDDCEEDLKMLRSELSKFSFEEEKEPPPLESAPIKC